MKYMLMTSALLALVGCNSGASTSDSRQQIVDQLINNEIRRPDGTTVFSESQQAAFTECARPKIEAELNQMSDQEISELQKNIPADAYASSSDPGYMRVATAFGECLDLVPFPNS